jgi:N-acetylmuramoyl-L-alanine amidase
MQASRSARSALLCIALAAGGVAPALGAGPVRQKAEKAAEAAPRPNRLIAVRHVGTEATSRVILEFAEPPTFKTGELPADSAAGLAPRVYVDLPATRLALDSRDPKSVEDRVVKRIRTGQFTPEVARVVIDLHSPAPHKATVLAHPHRLVIEFQGAAPPAASGTVPRSGRAAEAEGRRGAIRKIVLDPGHGGKDTGAIGPGGVMEKDIVLALAKKLAKRLRERLGIEVVLTREEDVFIPLEERTAIANAHGADLFVSLHVNASPNPHAQGIETYYLDNTDDEAALRLAARENGTSRRNVSDIQFILSDLIQSGKLEESIALAHHLHSALVSRLGQKARSVKDLGVKKAPFFVLVQAKMPSVLAEIGFITNAAEARQLTRESYQDAIVDGLLEGIRKYRDAGPRGKSL